MCLAEMCSVRPALRIVARALAGDHDVDAVIAEDALQQLDVGEARHVVEDERVLGEQARDHQRQGGVLGARNRDGAVQALAADDANSIHDAPLTAPFGRTITKNRAGLPARPSRPTGLLAFRLVRGNFGGNSGGIVLGRPWQPARGPWLAPCGD